MTPTNSSAPSAQTIPYPDRTAGIHGQTPLVTLAMLIFGEARNQPRATRLAVAFTVLNRIARAPHYPKDIKDVCLQKEQYSCFDENDPNCPKLLQPLGYEAPAVWQACVEAATEVLHGTARDFTGSATHYYDSSMKTPPYWAKLFTPTLSLMGMHFYRDQFKPGPLELSNV